MNYAIIIFDYLFQLLESGEWDLSDALHQTKTELFKFRNYMTIEEYLQTCELLDRFAALKNVP